MAETINNLLTNITNNTLTAQGTTAQILRDENSRLLDKQKLIDEAKFGQQRIIELNRSYSKKNAAYTKVMIFAAVALGIILILRFVGSSFIPEPIFALIYVLLISASILYGLYTYSYVNARETTNFDRLNIPPPAITMSEADKAKALASAQKKGDLMALSSGTCAGQACCDYNQAYNSTSNKCDTKCEDSSGQIDGYFNKTSNQCAKCPNTTNKKDGYFDKTYNRCAKCSNSEHTWKPDANGTYACRA